MARTDLLTRPSSDGPAAAAPALAQEGGSESPARRVVAWIRTAENATPLAIFGLTRALFVLLTYFGVVLFSSHLHDPTHPSLVHELLPRWQQWDSVWYIQIAQRGYAWHRAAGTSPSAFFPLYPTLIRIGVIVTHRSYILVAMAVSNGCFLMASFYLARLARWEHDECVARRTVLYIAIFPTALFFFAGYSESLFFFVAVAAFFHLRRREWLRAGIFVALASATRITGILLALPLLYEYARDSNFQMRAMVTRRGVPGILIAPSGIVLFMIYLKWQTGDAVGFSHGQAAWQKISTLRLWAGFTDTAHRIISIDPPASFYEAHNVLEITVGGLALIASIFACRRLPAAYGLYVAAFWLLTLFEPAMAGGYPVPLVSLSRYVLSLFPVFMYLGILGKRAWFNDAYLIVATGMLSLLTVQYINGGWVV